MRVRIDHFLSFEDHATHLWVCFSASRRSVFTRSPALVGTSVGAITSHATPNSANWSGRPHNTPATVPPGPASSPAYGSTPYDWLSCPGSRAEPFGSATATAIVEAWTSKPKNRTFAFMTGSSPLVALELCFRPESQPNPRSAHWTGRHILTMVERCGRQATSPEAVEVQPSPSFGSTLSRNRHQAEDNFAARAPASPP
jgi:hypothetical protein